MTILIVSSSIKFIGNSIDIFILVRDKGLQASCVLQTPGIYVYNYNDKLYLVPYYYYYH